MIAAASAWWSVSPSNERDWEADQARMPSAIFSGDTVTVTNIRDFEHCPKSGPAVERWETRSFDLSGIESVWLVLSVFKKNWRGPAHPFISFGFSDSTFLAVSVEARKEKGETFSAVKGMLKKYELIYVVALERDVLTLRAVCRTDRVYLYPLDVSPGKARLLLEGMLRRANELEAKPSFYNTLWNNCTTNIIARANEVAEEPIPGGYYSFLPGYADRVAMALGLIEEKGSLDETRRNHMVNDRAKRYAGDPRFSILVREQSF